MNCPACNQRNPSTASSCLHCGAQLAPQKSGGSFGSGSGSGEGMSNSTIGIVFVAFVAVVILTIGYLFGFNRVETQCTQISSEIASFEASAEWRRDQLEERRRYRKRYPNKANKPVIRSSSLRCYQKVIERVEGALEK